MKSLIVFAILGVVVADRPNGFNGNGNGYGAPPPPSNGYGAPTNGINGNGNGNGYGAPPPSNGYGAPTNGFNGNGNGNGNGYGAPTPPSNGYAAPRNTYGTPNGAYGVDPEIAALAENIPGGGVPGEDYPILASVPDTGFSCDAQAVQGYYADTAAEAGCQVFHICQDRALSRQQDSFLCPNGTIFNQQYLVCDWWFNVDCSQAESFYSVNELIGVVPDAGYAYGPATNGNGNGYGSNGNGRNGNGKNGSNGYGSNGNGKNGNGGSNGNGYGAPPAPSNGYGAPTAPSNSYGTPF